MKMGTKYLVTACLLAIGATQLVQAADFNASLAALSKRVTLALEFDANKVTPAMSFVEKRKVDPLGLNDLGEVDRVTVQDAARKIKAFVDAYAGGGAGFDSAKQKTFGAQMRSYRASDIAALKNLATEAAGTFEMRPK